MSVTSTSLIFNNELIHRFLCLALCFPFVFCVSVWLQAEESVLQLRDKVSALQDKQKLQPSQSSISFEKKLGMCACILCLSSPHAPCQTAPHPRNTHTQTHTHMYTHMYTHTHTHTLSLSLSLSRSLCGCCTDDLFQRGAKSKDERIKTLESRLEKLNDENDQLKTVCGLGIAVVPMHTTEAREGGEGETERQRCRQGDRGGAESICACVCCSAHLLFVANTTPPPPTPPP